VGFEVLRIFFVFRIIHGAKSCPLVFMESLQNAELP
jgi:hypothetical protein